MKILYDSFFEKSHKESFVIIQNKIIFEWLTMCLQAHNTKNS